MLSIKYSYKSILQFSGYLYDVTGDFNNTFYFASSLGFAAGVLGLIVTLMHGRTKSVQQLDTGLSASEDKPQTTDVTRV